MSAGDHLFVEGWTGEDELSLLKAIEHFGYGNWCVSLLYPSKLATRTASSRRYTLQLCVCSVGLAWATVSNGVPKVERRNSGKATYLLELLSL